MTKINSREEQPAVSTGVLYPATQNKWRVLVAGKKLIAQQVTKCSIDLKEHTFALTVEQPLQLANEFFREVDSIVSRFYQNCFNLEFSIELLDGANEAGIPLITGYANVVKHELSLDYSQSGTAVHQLLFAYKPTAV